MGNDACIFASIFGRPKNLQYWLERVKDWDLNRQNTRLVVVRLETRCTWVRTNLKQ